MKTIGIFDSGVGGLSVANSIQTALPDNKVIYVDDKKNIPYGDKSPEELLEIVVPILNKLSIECDVIVVACNTVSTSIIEDLRKAIGIPLIAMEPMVKPAAELTKTGIITVCATPTTLASKRYAYLKQTFAHGVTVLEPDCSDWSRMIQDNKIDQDKIKSRIQQTLDQNSDIIVLGCTHYHWIENLIKQIVNKRALVLQPEQPVIDQLKRVLAQLD